MGKRECHDENDSANSQRLHRLHTTLKEKCSGIRTPRPLSPQAISHHCWGFVKSHVLITVSRLRRSLFLGDIFLPSNPFIGECDRSASDIRPDAAVRGQALLFTVEFDSVELAFPHPQGLLLRSKEDLSCRIGDPGSIEIDRAL